MAEISLRLSEIEAELGEENMLKHAAYVKDQIVQNINSFSADSTSHCWSLLRKIRPKHISPVPVGKYDSMDRLVTDQKELKKLYLETFIWRLRDRPIKPDLVELQSVKLAMFDSILKYCKKQKCELWTIKDLKSVLSSLKKNKCQDPSGLINELFFTQNAGMDLKKSMLMLFNKIKESCQIPSFMKLGDISAIYKGRG